MTDIQESIDRIKYRMGAASNAKVHDDEDKDYHVAESQADILRLVTTVERMLQVADMLGNEGMRCYHASILSGGFVPDDDVGGSAYQHSYESIMQALESTLNDEQEEDED